MGPQPFRSKGGRVRIQDVELTTLTIFVGVYQASNDLGTTALGLGYDAMERRETSSSDCSGTSLDPVREAAAGAAEAVEAKYRLVNVNPFMDTEPKTSPRMRTKRMHRADGLYHL